MVNQEENAEQMEHPFEKEEGIYERNIDTLRTHLGSDFEEGAERFGFALFHSLPLEGQFLYRERLGIECRNGVEHYNRGLAYASREDYDNAIRHWKQALDSQHPVAEAAWNMGLAYERMGDQEKAIASYRRYIEMVDSDEEKEKVQKHLDELGG